MIVYATLDDLSNTPGYSSGDDDEALLEFASDMVRKATANDVYATDAGALPTDPILIEAMMRATCAQILAWQFATPPITLKDLYAGAAATLPMGSQSGIGSASVAFATGTGMKNGGGVGAMQAARNELITCLSDRALVILRNVNMATAAVGLW